MFKSVFISIMFTLGLSGPSFSMEKSAVRVGDRVRTNQFYFSDHVAVVVYIHRGTATIDDHDAILLAENSEGGVKLTWLKDFIIKENDISLVPPPPFFTTSEPYLVVARAISALRSDIEYDIAVKSCGLFADWCAFGNWSGVNDFRDPNNRSLTIIPKYVVLPLCKCGFIGKWILVKAATSFNEKFGKELDSLTPEEIDSIGKSEEGYSNYLKNLIARDNLSLATKSSENIPAIKDIVIAAFLLPENKINLSPANVAKLKSMDDDQTATLCSEIVDRYVRGEVVDVNLLIERSNF